MLVTAPPLLRHRLAGIALIVYWQVTLLDCSAVHVSLVGKGAFLSAGDAIGRSCVRHQVAKVLHLS